MHLKVVRETILKVDEEILSSNAERLSDQDLAALLYASILYGSQLSCVSEAVEIQTEKVLTVERIDSQ
jgi:hypothetical protein